MPQRGVLLFKAPEASNLWVCTAPSPFCDGPGEGGLVLTEEVAGIPGGAGLKSFAFAFTFDDRAVDVTLKEGPFLGSTGRETTCSATFVGHYEMRFACDSTGAQTGPTGAGVLATITVRPNADLRLRPTQGNGVVVLFNNLAAEAELVDTMGQSISLSRVADAVVIVRALEGDINFDCIVNVVDDQAVSARFQTDPGSLLYDILYDLEQRFPDGDIDVKDLQFVYGRNRSTCGAPTPPQPSPTPAETPSVPTATPVAPTATSTATALSATPTRTPTRMATPAAATETPAPTRTLKPATPTPKPASPVPATATTTVAPVERAPTATPVVGLLPVERTPVPPEGLPFAGGASTPAGWDWTIGLGALTALLAAGALALVSRTVRYAGTCREGNESRERRGQ